LVVEKNLTKYRKPFQNSESFEDLIENDRESFGKSRNKNIDDIAYRKGG